jgi:hypothetical protein
VKLLWKDVSLMEILPEAYPLRVPVVLRPSVILPIASDSFCSIGGRAPLYREIGLRFE